MTIGGYDATPCALAPYGLHDDMSRSALELQCEIIEWPVHVRRATYLGKRRWSDGLIANGSPEEIVAAQIASEGQQSSWCEGGSLNILIKAASLEALTRRNSFGDRQDAIRRYLEAQFTILEAHQPEILHCIQTIQYEQLQSNIAEICADELIQSFYPRVSSDFVNALARTLDTRFIAEVAAALMVKPYDYRSGWPDLTVIDDEGISLVEVKTTDKLHASQVRFAREVARPLGLRCCVVQVKQSIAGGLSQ